MIKKCILVAVFASIMIGCGKKEYTAENTTEPEIIEEPPEVLDPSLITDFIKTEGSKMVLKKDKSFDTHLFDLKFIDEVEGQNKMAFYIFSGRYCTECDAPISLYFHAPEMGKLDVSEGRNAYQMIGDCKDIESGKVISTSRVFYGQVLNNITGMMGYVENQVTKKRSIWLAKIENNKIINEILEDKGQLEETLKLLSEGKCSEMHSE